MVRNYLKNKELIIDTDYYARYNILNLYEETEFQRKSHLISVFGLFLSDLPAYENKFHGNEVHFPILFINIEQANKLFDKINRHTDIVIFEGLLEEIISINS